jgi:hypothetical protein
MKALRHGLPLLLTYLRFAVAMFAGGSNSTTRIGNRRSFFRQRDMPTFREFNGSSESGTNSLRQVVVVVCPSATAHEEPSPNQWITNKTPQPNANTRQRMSAKIPIITDFSG